MALGVLSRWEVGVARRAAAQDGLIRTASRYEWARSKLRILPSRRSQHAHGACRRTYKCRNPCSSRCRSLPLPCRGVQPIPVGGAMSRPKNRWTCPIDDVQKGPRVTLPHASTPTPLRRRCRSAPTRGRGAKGAVCAALKDTST